MATRSAGKRVKMGPTLARQSLEHYMARSRVVLRDKVRYVANVQRKIKAGIYDATAAIELWEVYVVHAAQSYTAHHVQPSGTHFWDLFPLPMCRQIAESVSVVEYKKIVAGVYDDYTRSGNRRSRGTQ